jgi:PAS domain S-box-containing protein
MPYVVSFIVFCVGCLLLLGYLLNLTPLHPVLQIFTATIPLSTALCFMLAGGTLALMVYPDLPATERETQTPPNSGLLMRIASLGGAAILLISLWAMVEYGIGWNVGVERLTFSSQANLATSSSGKMAIGTAVKFLLVGTALLLFAQPAQTCIKFAQLLTLTTAAITLQASLSDGLGMGIFQPLNIHSTSALPTTLTFLILCVGMLFLRPQQGLMQPLMTQLEGGVLARRLLPTTILLPLILGWCLVCGYRAGYYPPEFAVTLLVVTLVVVQTLLIGRSVSWLNRNDTDRRHRETLRQQSQSSQESTTHFQDITNRKQFEANYGNFFRLSLDLLCVAGTDGYFKQLNPAFERVLGYSEAELLNQPFINFIHPDDQASSLAALQQLSQGEPITHFENRYRCKDGSYRWLDWMTKPVAEEGLLYAVAHDITSRKQLEAELRINEARFRRLYDANIIGIVIASFTGDILEANDAFLQTVGCDRADLENQKISWLSMTPTEYLPLDHASIQQVQQTGTGPIYEKEFIRKDGSRVAVLLGAALLPDSPETAICFILDLTERKQTESALRESEHRFRYMTDSAPMLVWMSGIDQQCNYFNQAWLNFTGRTLEQELGHGWTEGIHPDDFQHCLNTYTTAFEARQPFEMEYRLRRSDDTYRWLLDIGVPRYTPAGEFLGYIGSCLDIHDRKQAETDIHRLNETLEQRVKERTLQLEVANKELESFSYSVSHDLRAPLRHIAGFVELLQKHLDPTLLDATSQRYLSIIVETTRQAGILIDDLLSFSYMGRSEMRWIAVDLQRIVQDIQQELEPEVAQRQIYWQIDALPTVEGDPTMLRLVLRNLIENAVKYTRLRNQAEIHIGSLSNEQEDVFFVRDNGIGFNMQYAHKLFGIFQRLHSDPNYEGTGIGLANVQRIIHRHGGKTWAESTLNQGATFYFSLPKSNQQLD